MVKPVHKVHRPVDRVDDKHGLGTQIVVAVVLLAEKARIGTYRAQALDQQGLDLAVVLGDDVAVTAFALGQDAVSVHHEARRLPLRRLHRGENGGILRN